jgi:GDPmannose 4,6-dehydratase
MPTALITGISGQDGTYLAEHLLQLGYAVAGTSRDVAAAADRLPGSLRTSVALYQASLLDADGLSRVVREVRPDEVYNLAGSSHVGRSWQDVVAVGDANALGVARLLEAVRLGASEACVFQASSCEMFGGSDRPLSEASPLRPTSPYAIAKQYGHVLCGAYRRSLGLRVASGILFNHESPRRDPSFVSRKITRGAARIARGVETALPLGNLDVTRDWGFAGDHVCAMHLMLQHDPPEDFVIGTGEGHTVREFCEAAFRVVGLDYREHVTVDARFVRTGEAPACVADASRARTRLGWTPKVSFAELVAMMVSADMQTLDA